MVLVAGRGWLQFGGGWVLGVGGERVGRGFGGLFVWPFWGCGLVSVLRRLVVPVVQLGVVMSFLMGVVCGFDVVCFLWFVLFFFPGVWSSLGSESSVLFVAAILVILSGFLLCFQDSAFPLA